MKDIEQMITELIDREGRKYTNDPTDRGGPTKFGITQTTLTRWRKRPTTADDVQAMEEPEARAIYEHQYLIESGINQIHDPYVMTLAFDCAVNHGSNRAVRWLQQAAGVTDDGVFGPRTEAAVNTVEPVRLYHAVLARRIRFFGDIITHDSERLRAARDGYRLQARFAKGWLSRAAEFIDTYPY